MENSNFSTLIYRIIGKPDRWHEDYIDMMHRVLDETDSFDDPQNFSELAIGDQILSRISNTNEALHAFGSLLDRSRFKMIILDDKFKPIYHNQNAKDLLEFVRHKSHADSLDLSVLKKVNNAANLNQKNRHDGINGSLSALELVDENGDEVYLRTIENRNQEDEFISRFYLLLVVDQSRDKNQLNQGLIERYDITDKEHNVLVNLVHGKNIKEIASLCFISENTVKTHLKALFRKTETKSQADIIRLILTHESQVLDSYFGTSVGNMDDPLDLAEEKSILLSTGLEVAYREYGPVDGYPVIVCHNGYGCRLSIPKNYNEICNKANKRIIIPDRPGYGRTPHIKQKPEKWSAHLNDFIGQLGLSEYDIIGTVLGSCIALVFAEQADSRLKRVKLACPVFVNERKDAKLLTGILAPSVRLVRASKRFAREIYELWLKSVTMNLSTHYRSMLDRSLGDAEREQFEVDGTLDLMVKTFKEGSSRSLEGISQEMVYCISPRKINLAKITIPVDIWWGTQDNRISREGVENLAAKLPNVTIHIRDGYSEHIYYSLFEEIIS